MEEARVRFFKKVNKTDTCWLWSGSIYRDGYAKFHIKNKSHGAHRVSWFLAGNTIPDGHLIRHKCRNRHCVNPEHLETGTQQDNMNDKVRDGIVNDWTSGEDNPKVKLTEEQVRAIRANPDNKNVKQLSIDYGVSAPAIYKVVSRRTWKHL